MAQSGTALRQSTVYGLRSTVVLLCVALAGAQEPAPQPRFATKAELILVDVSVVDDNGQPVPDLTEKDFDLRVNGQPRPVESVQFISTTELKSATQPSPRDAYFTTNAAPTSGRLLLFVVDENHLRFGGARGVLRTADLAMNALAPGDMVALTLLPHARGGVEFTTDRARIRTALESVSGRQPAKQIHLLRFNEAWAFETNNAPVWSRVLERECERGAAPDRTGASMSPCVRQLEAEARGLIQEASQRAAQSISALEQLMTHMASYLTPVTVIFISEGLFIARDRNGLDNLGRQAATARVTLHVVQPGQSMFEGGTVPTIGLGFGDEPMLAEGLETLAGHARGTFHRILQGTGEHAFSRISRELSGYYLLSFAPTERDRSSRERSLRVAVRRSDVTVHARSTYAPPQPAPATETRKHGEQLKQLLLAPLPTAGVSMRVSTYTVTYPQSKQLRVIVSAEIGEPASQPTDWPIGMLVLDKDGKAVANTIETTKLIPVSPGVESPRLFFTSVLLEPGEYSLRLAAVAPDGKAGSVHHVARAMLVPLRVGSEVRASDFVLASDPARSEGLPRPTPSAMIDSASLWAGLELTGAPNTLPKCRVRIEIATNANAASLLTANAKPSERTTTAHLGFDALLPLATLAPGEYIARAIVSVPGQPDVTITRPFKRAEVLR